MLCIARYAGLRIHECMRIDTAIAEKAIRDMEITIKGKGGKVRTVPINESIHIVLRDRLAVTKRGQKLFVADNMPTDAATTLFQQFIERHRYEIRDPDSDKRLTFHGLRHSCAAEWYTGFINQGYSPLDARKKVSMLLGHERDDVTKIYLAGIKDGDDDF